MVFSHFPRVLQIGDAVPCSDVRVAAGSHRARRCEPDHRSGHRVCGWLMSWSVGLTDSWACAGCERGARQAPWHARRNQGLCSSGAAHRHAHITILAAKLLCVASTIWWP
eukprot:3143158-Rhodomonas_salina.3